MYLGSSLFAGTLNFFFKLVKAETIECLILSDLIILKNGGFVWKEIAALHSFR